jgi:hypothetical protein
MTKPANLLAGFGVFLIGLFFKATNEHHHSKAIALKLSNRFGHGAPIRAHCGGYAIRGRYTVGNGSGTNSYFISYGHLVAPK